MKIDPMCSIRKKPREGTILTAFQKEYIQKKRGLSVCGGMQTVFKIFVYLFIDTLESGRNAVSSYFLS